MFRQYIILVRLPNIFTAASNILSGYFTIVATVSSSFINLHLLYLVGLMTSSSLLYLAGIVFNDYFDIEIDKKERLTRPLPSGKITKRKALTIAISSMIAANVITLVINWTSFIIAIILTTIIIAYDYGLKHNNITGPIIMGLARSINVILGASPALSMLLLSVTASKMLLFIAISLFLYIVAISILSKKEVSGKATNLIIISSLSIVFVDIAAIAIAGLIGIFQPAVFAFLVLFSVVMIITFRPILRGLDNLAPIHIRDIIKNMIISIIILDSVFVSGLIGLPYGLATLLLLVPSVLLSRKLYLT
ncbi:MAG TPA: UbiA family prenyltransferase [Nitrososphaeraceae archaeon]|nr:UbiA family prenyltransferase [Nitrososphaeraceae archaeon]